MPKTTKKQELALNAISQLKILYPEAVCSLVYNHEKPYELLIATRLSAQCTDARVNIVTEVLFKKYTTLQAIADAELSDIENIIRSCGFYKVKAKDTILMCKQLIERHGGELPSTMEELTALSGIGRKTANLILGDIFHQPSIVTDTHCIRITGRLGLTDGSDDPKKVEDQLRKLLPPEESGDFCHRLVHFGRDVCIARSPRCGECTLFNICVNSPLKDKADKTKKAKA